MRPPLLLLLCLPAACVVLPDEVSVSGMQSDYDYLGGDDLKGLGSENGASTGVMVTATYRLKPQQVQLVGPSWNRPQVETADRRLAETADRRLAETAETADRRLAETADRLLDQTAETAEAAFRRAGQTAETAMQTAADNAGYLFLKNLLRPLIFVGGATLVALVLLVLLFRRCARLK